MARAAQHADPSDIASVRLYAETLAQTHQPFTSEDVLAMLSDTQRERLAYFPNAMGAIYFQLHREGTLENCGAVHAKRPEARGRYLTLWRGAR